MPILLLIVFILSGCSLPESSDPQSKAPKEPIPQLKEEDVRAEDIQKLTLGGLVLFEEVDGEIHTGNSNKNNVEKFVDVFVEEIETLTSDDYNKMYEDFLSKKYNLVQKKFINSINKYVNKAREIYNQKLYYPIVTFDKPTLRTGSHVAATFRVKYNSLLAIPIIDVILKGQDHLENLEVYRKYQSKIDQYIDAIAVHEVAHYVDFKINGALGTHAGEHKGEWCNVMYNLGVDPSKPPSLSISERSKPVPLSDGRKGESYTRAKNILSLVAYCIPKAT